MTRIIKDNNMKATIIKVSGDRGIFLSDSGYGYYCDADDELVLGDVICGELDSHGDSRVQRSDGFYIKIYIDALGMDKNTALGLLQ